MSRKAVKLNCLAADGRYSLILDEVYTNLPTPPFTPEEMKAVAAEVYTHVWQQAVRGEFAMAA